MQGRTWLPSKAADVRRRLRAAYAALRNRKPPGDAMETFSDSLPERPAAAQPMFSFLSPAYRTENTISRTIDSVRAQTRSDWELVVVDNGNSDAIAAVVAPYLSDPRIRLIRQENEGPIGGTMAASAAAHGRYLVALNSDDWVTPDFCVRTGQILDAHPEIAAVTCDAHLFTDPGGSRLSRSYLENAGARDRLDGSRPLRLADVIEGPCPYYSAPIRRDVWDAMGGLATDTPIVGDLDFWLRTLSAGYDVRMISDRLGVYRIDAGSVSRPVDPMRSEVFEEQRERALSRAALRSGDPADIAALERVLRRLRYQQAIRRARVAIQKGSVEEARRQCRCAFAQRTTLRAGAILVMLRVAPSALVRIHPVKQRVQERLQRRVRQLRRTSLRRSPAGLT
jgi:GT2 family glycosyltransferase